VAREITYKADIKGTGDFMRGKEMEAFLRRKGHEGKQFAEAIASDFVRTGEYASSFRVTSSKRGAGKFTDRAAGYLYNDSDHAYLVEYVDDYRVLGAVADILENGL
jgi:hypothetical protein